MFFAPHILYVKRVTIQRDKYNRALPPKGEWEELCECRCDDNMSTKFETENGKVYRPMYHIVCPPNVDVKENEEVKVYIKDSKKLRGEGIVNRVRHLNKLEYSEIWV